MNHQTSLSALLRARPSGSALVSSHLIHPVFADAYGFPPLPAAWRNAWCCASTRKAVRLCLRVLGAFGTQVEQAKRP